jgi:uncharacterized cupin superfamily protein
VPNIYDAELEPVDAGRRARLAAAAGAEHLGASLYELAPGDGMHFHYHLGREELLIVLSGRLSLRTGDGWRELAEGELVAFPRGERGAHGFENRGEAAVRVLVVSEQNAPNVSVYPDENRVGIFDAPHPHQRRFGALFDVSDAVEDYGGGAAAIVPPDTGSAGSSSGG